MPPGLNVLASNARDKFKPFADLKEAELTPGGSEVVVSCVWLLQPAAIAIVTSTKRTTKIIPPVFHLSLAPSIITKLSLRIDIYQIYFSTINGLPGVEAG